MLEEIRMECKFCCSIDIESKCIEPNHISQLLCYCIDITVINGWFDSPMHFKMIYDRSKYNRKYSSMLFAYFIFKMIPFYYRLKVDSKQIMLNWYWKYMFRPEKKYRTTDVADNIKVGKKLQ